MTAGVAHYQRLGVTGPPPKVRLHGEATTPLVSPFVGHGFHSPFPNARSTARCALPRTNVQGRLGDRLSGTGLVSSR